MSFYDDWVNTFTYIGRDSDKGEKDIDRDSPCKCCDNRNPPCMCYVCDGTDDCCCYCGYCDCNFK